MVLLPVSAGAQTLSVGTRSSTPCVSNLQLTAASTAYTGAQVALKASAAVTASCSLDLEFLDRTAASSDWSVLQKWGASGGLVQTKAAEPASYTVSSFGLSERRVQLSPAKPAQYQLASPPFVRPTESGHRYGVEAIEASAPPPATYVYSGTATYTAPSTPGQVDLLVLAGFPGDTMASATAELSVSSPPPPPPPAPAAYGGGGSSRSYVSGPPYFDRLISSNGALNVSVSYYSDCSGATPLTRYGVAIDTCVHSYLYFVGHNPGPFTPAVGLPVGSEVTYWDGSGTPHAWVVTSKQDLPFDGGNDPAFFDQPAVAVFQTCATLDESWDWIIDLEPA